MKDIYVYKWVPGQKKDFIHFDSANLAPKGVHEKITNGLLTFILSLLGKKKGKFYKANFSFPF